jgi:hypothetical protein
LVSALAGATPNTRATVSNTRRASNLLLPPESFKC